ncbi:MAG TPA: hypothetical protein VGF32_06920, partial [Streptosporangiaceae bacterium]
MTELAGVPAVISDPVGATVDLITSVEVGLDRGAVEEVVAGVAGGRAKRRKLAQALAERPAVLADGRSPAPRVVGDLLIALINAGATAICPPICTNCGKPLRTLQRRGEDWYCAVCGPRREPCASCDKVRAIRVRDRHGQPRCVHCPPDGGRDPIDLVVDVVTTVDPSLPAAVVSAAVEAVVPSPGRRYQLAWALQDRPELLTGAGAHAPVPAVLRLIDRLCGAGAEAVVRPACPHCGRVIPLVKPRDGVRLCRNCVAKSRAEPCSRCGTVREAATRDGQGRPLCPNCLVSDPANLEVCVNCGRRRTVNTRTPDGPLCPGCPSLPMADCSICGQHRPCGTSRLTGLPWCPHCQDRSARCARCQQVAPIRSGTLDKPLCRSCTIPA